MPGVLSVNYSQLHHYLTVPLPFKTAEAIETLSSVETGVEGAPHLFAPSCVHLFGSERVATYDLLAVSPIDAAGEAAEVAPQVFEKALR